MSGEIQAKTYKEALIADEVARRSVDLVPRLANILRRRGAVFHGRTTDSQWQDAEKKLGFQLPPDYKLLCNTIGTSGVWCGGSVGLNGPTEMYQRMTDIKENYASWQSKQSPQQVVVFPKQPGFHLEWSCDLEGNALSFFWVVNDNDPSRWPTVQMELEAPLRHNLSIYPATVTECLYREVIGRHGKFYDLGDYESDDEEEEEEDDENEITVVINKRAVFKFDTSMDEPDAKKQKQPEDAKDGQEDNNEDDSPGSPADKADFEFLGEPEFEPIAAETMCKDTASLDIED